MAINQIVTRIQPGPIREEERILSVCDLLSPARRTHERVRSSSLITRLMTWKLSDNLIDAELSNLVPGWVEGWMRLYRHGKSPLEVHISLRGNFDMDIEGKVLRLKNQKPRDRNVTRSKEGTYLEGFSPVQLGLVTTIGAGLSEPDKSNESQQLKLENELDWERLDLGREDPEGRRREWGDQHPTRADENGIFQPHVAHPRIEWLSTDGFVVLEPDPSQIEILDEDIPRLEAKTDRELLEALTRRLRTTDALVRELVKESDRRERRSEDRWSFAKLFR